MEGLLKNIYWKPAIRYVIDEIVVFNPIQYMTLTRNELKEKLPLSAVKKQMKDPSVDICIYTDVIKNMTQRSSRILTNVKYGIRFHFELTGIRNEEEEENGAEKHYNIIRKRLKKGRFFNCPYLGCREFSVSSITMVNDFNYRSISEEILAAGDVDLGYMLYHMVFKDGGIPKNGDFENPIYRDEASPEFYHPHMINGVINVAGYREVEHAD